MPMPSKIVREGQRLPASYANFYIGNKVVLMPCFNDPHDAWAASVLRQAFPGRRIVPIDSCELIWGLGAFHCLTQQQPLGVLLEIQNPRASRSLIGSSWPRQNSGRTIFLESRSTAHPRSQRRMRAVETPVSLEASDTV